MTSAGAESVREVLRSRLRSGTLPANRDDPHRVALLVEGGGMRGVISAGMVDALAAAGVRPAFDLAVGVSAGACNVAALLSDTTTGLVETYAETFATREFIDPRGMWRGRPLIDVTRMVRYVGAGLDEGRFGRALAGQIPWWPVASRVSTARPAPLTGLESAEEVKLALTASCMLPLLGGRPVSFRGERYIDGGVLDPLGIHTALEWGATHAVLLTTRSAAAQSAPSRLDPIAARYLRSLNPAFVAPYRARSAEYSEHSRQAGAGSIAGMQIMAVRVDGLTVLPSRLERDRDVMVRAGQAGRTAAHRAFAQVCGD
jgi:predicted patatin/cPLA2 family phospholipase